ncbi:PDR/VanB family oxidoreductase [Nocardia veterana]|uniref:Oxidoreductase n=1 Tax=Nocardia veterana TaxID=132249 RepID=A0A7X6RJF0_9NOCA|nr:PDR/VanB family oxidoreductase [Nocardia veterana]NKY87608.1 oxidoreductase [Nocardia veterana]
MITTTERLTLRTTAVRKIADDVVELTFADAEGHELPGWEPGAHIELELPSGLSRQYSLCGSPADRSIYTVAVLREENGRGGSREIHEIASTGMQFEISLPKNHFPLVAADSYLFIGGGIGITPLIPMIEEARRRGATWRLVYGGRSATSMAYRDVLANSGEQADIWIESERGYPDLPAILAGAPAGTQVYTCGPTAMIDAVAAEFTRHPHLGGLHFERFSASGPIDTGGDSFEVELRRTGATFTVPEDSTILAEVQKLLPNHPSSCEEGYCGECETRVLEGEPDHRDDYLTEQEQEQGDVMMICVSRCKGPCLVLDL